MKSTVLKIYFCKNKIHTIAIIICIGIFAVNLIRFINLPTVTASGLDNSGVWALNHIARTNQFSFGKDFVWTYGPLGYFILGGNSKLVIAKAFIANILIIVILFLQFLHLAKHRIILTDKNRSYLFPLVVFFGIIWSIEWIWSMNLFILSSTIFILREKRNEFIIYSLIFGILVSLSLLIKFNTGVLGIALALILGGILLLVDYKRFIFYVIIFVSSFLFSTIINIIMHFGGIEYFMTWITMSIEIAKGYSWSMVTIGLGKYIVISLLLIIFFESFGLIVLYKNSGKNKDLPFIYILSMIPLFFAFKVGFVRQDIHMLNFFPTFIIIMVFVYMLSLNYIHDTFIESRKFLMNSFAKFTIIICLLCINSIVPGFLEERLFSGVNRIRSLSYSINSFNERRAYIPQEDKLPDDWNELIGGSSIQVLPWELMYAKANNWPGWTPNPVFQLYAAYTKKLDEFSAQSFLPGREPPEYILLQFLAIDNRNMFLDNPATWNAIINNYSAVEHDNNRVLLKKKHSFTGLELTAISSDIYKFEEEIPIPEHEYHVFARIHIKPTILGRIITTFFRGNPSTITLMHKLGFSVLYRIIDDTLRTPVLIDVVPTNLNDMTDIIANLDNVPAQLQSIIFSNTKPYMFRNEIAIEWFYSKFKRPIGTYTYETFVPVQISEIPFYKADIYSAVINDEELHLICGNKDPYVVMPLPESIELPAGKPYIEIEYNNDTAGNLQVFYDYGKGFSEGNSTGLLSIGSSEGLKDKLIVPVAGWLEGKQLQAIRMDPPDGSVFVLSEINILNQEIFKER